jgi:hypothetical protein
MNGNHISRKHTQPHLRIFAEVSISLSFQQQLQSAGSDFLTMRSPNMRV